MHGSNARRTYEMIQRQRSHSDRPGRTTLGVPVKLDDILFHGTTLFRAHIAGAASAKRSAASFSRPGTL